MRSPGLYVELEPWNYHFVQYLRASKNWDRAGVDYLHKIQD